MEKLFSKTIQHPNSREEEIFNREFKRYRVVVEISINQIHKWKICYHKFHSKLLNLEYALQEKPFHCRDSGRFS